jgi:hypothetical protein
VARDHEEPDLLAGPSDCANHSAPFCPGLSRTSKVHEGYA